MQASLFAPTLFPFPCCVFTVYCHLPVAVDILSFFPSYTLHCLPSSIVLPLTLLSFCLTAVGLLWEVIRKNSTETHTHQLLKTRLSILSPLPPCVTIAIGWESGKDEDKGGYTGTIPGHLSGMMSEGKCRFGIPKLLCAEAPDASSKLLPPTCGTQRQKVFVRSCLANCSPVKVTLRREGDIKKLRMRLLKGDTCSNLGQRQSCFSSFKRFVHFVDAQNCMSLAPCLLLWRLVNKTVG